MVPHLVVRRRVVRFPVGLCPVERCLTVGRRLAVRCSVAACLAVRRRWARLLVVLLLVARRRVGRCLPVGLRLVLCLRVLHLPVGCLVVGRLGLRPAGVRLRLVDRLLRRVPHLLEPGPGPALRWRVEPVGSRLRLVARPVVAVVGVGLRRRRLVRSPPSLPPLLVGTRTFVGTMRSTRVR
ncbi:hypothetical protein ALI22I_36110 [Saccharothrix sp. ALI-22-I]|nr:hypothetical protein ALI22I_36110 [Saccharothrix sp. ALI-22-I]